MISTSRNNGDGEKKDAEIRKLLPRKNNQLEDTTDG